MSAPRQIAEMPPPRPALRRMPKNPIDRSTIVSIYPKAIREVKHTIEPGIFEIEAGSLENPAILVVGSSSWWSYSGDTRPTIEVPISSVQIAEAVIKDFSNGMLECDMDSSRPGLFFVPGELNLLEVKMKYKETLVEVNAKQRNWFHKLVSIADALWATSNNNPRAISDEMRLAAENLNLKDKPWLRDFRTIELVPCVACGSLKNPAFPVCSNCKHIDNAHPNSKGLEFAKG